MLKLFSLFKHEEFESNSALQIRDQKEIRAKNYKENGTCEICILRALFMPPANTVHPTATVHLLFDVVPCLFQFLFLPILSLVISFCFIFSCSFPYFEPYIS